MVWIDYCILAVVALSILISLLRGFVKEAISLGTWVLAFWLALTFAGRLAEWFVGSVASTALRYMLAFAILFVAVLILGAIINYVVSTLVEKTGLSGTDRLIGAIFGFARGLVVVAALVLLAGLTRLPESDVWHQSRFVPYVQPITAWLRHVLPIGPSHSAPVAAPANLEGH
jgi:membrane protein required for colicin V production